MDEPGLSAWLEALPAVVVEEAPHGTDREAGNSSGEGQPQEEPMLAADEAPLEVNFEVGGLPGDGQARGRQVLDKSPIFTEKERANYERTIFEQSLTSIGAGCLPCHGSRASPRRFLEKQSRTTCPRSRT